MLKMSLRWAIAVITLILIAGCLGSLGGPAYADEYVENLNRRAIYDPDQISECNIGTCSCMVCTNGSNIFGPLRNLVGGSCHFEEECDADRVAELGDATETPESSIRHFMIGQGPSFADFSAANPYCSHRLSMAVQWLTGTNETPYRMPQASRAMCFLSKDIMPVYVLYSKSENINITRTREIAYELGHGGGTLFGGLLTEGPVGPVVVTTEIDFNESEAHLVADQVREINTACGNDRTNSEIYCMVAVAPKMGDTASLDLVMQEVGDEVDLVAYGINYRYLDHCDGARALMNAINFSSYALYHWGKPSIIPYVMFDSVGQSSDESCEWSENRMISAYSSFFPGGILTLQQKGVIGIAPYSFNSTTYGVLNPLGCEDCGVGADEQRLRSWYAYCQSYTNITRRAPTGATTSHPSGSNLIVFPNESGGYCDFTAQIDYILRETSFGDATSSRDIMNPRMPELREPTSTYFTCETCLINNIDLEPPFPSIATLGDGIRTDDPGEICTAYPEIRQFASYRDVDQNLVRAFIYDESEFDECAAAKVCSSGYKASSGDTTCFGHTYTGDDECYAKGYSFMEDPSGECDLENAPNYEDDRPDWRWCALGMVQSLTPPYTFWPEQFREEGTGDGPFLEFYRDANSRRKTQFDPENWWGDPALASECDPEFNPFNATHSICVGAEGVASALAYGRQWVADHQSELGFGADDYEKSAVMAAYVAGWRYTGWWNSEISDNVRAHPRCGAREENQECWIRWFNLYREVDADFCQRDSEGHLPEECEAEGVPLQRPPDICWGYTDFIEYVHECEVPFTIRQQDPGLERIQLYYWFSTQCEDSFCPDGRRLVNAMCEADDTGAYNQDLCVAPGIPRHPESGTYYIPDGEGEEEESEEEEEESEE